MINAMQAAAENEETLALVNPAEWGGFALELAEKAPPILSAAVQIFKTQAQKNKFAIMVAAAGTAGVWGAGEPVAEAAHKFVFADGLFGYPAENQDGEGGGGGEKEDDDTSPTEKTTASLSTTSCDPSATVDENSVCILLDCNAPS